ncbi:MAG: mechanosensitive ion channel family protein [Rhodothermaceae bacterium]
MIEQIKIFLQENPLTAEVLNITGVLLLSFVVYLITKKVIVNSIHKLISKTKTEVDDILLTDQLLKRISMAAPLLVINYFAYIFEGFESFIDRVSSALIAFFILLAISTLLGSITTLLERTDKLRDKPIKGYVQVVRIILYIFGGILIVGLLANESPFTLLSAIGALTAVIILVFKDTILSFVASIQISTYDLVKVGDWIEVPKYGADGDVLDIALHTIKVQNFDKTITVIPTYKLIEDSYKNWRGMQLSGGRRIKRSLYIDKTSIHFLSEPQIDELKKIDLISGYLSEKDEEVKKFNSSDSVNTLVESNKRRLTNVGTFREYIKSYLQSRDDIHKDMTFLVRQLSSGATGVPIEIYVFTVTTDWIDYEAIQSDIFDHLLAIVPEFGLRVFQNPTGNDFSNLSK